MSESRRGQGAFEYILMLSGVLLIVILIIFILQGTLSGTNNTMASQQNTFNTSVTMDVVPQYTANLVVTSAQNGLTGTAYPCCENWAGVGCNTTGVTANCTPASNALSCPTSKFDRKTGKCV
jgi:hypothetical protein